jgi:CBS domain-containing protein/tetratricopeptide (TPR) repeat protein
METFNFSERGGAPVNIKDLIKDLADPGTPDERAIQDFTDACRRADEDPRERQRYRDIADLIDTEDALYAQAVAALDRGNHDTALPLLRLAAERAIGDAAWLLAVTLDERGEADEAIRWYERAALDRDPRAAAALSTRQAPGVLAARRDMLALDLLARHSADAASPPEETPRSGLWSPRAIIVTANYDWYIDCQFSGVRHPTWPFPANLSGGSEYLQAALSEFCAAMPRPECEPLLKMHPCPVTTEPASARQLAKTLRLIYTLRLVTELESTRNAIAHGRHADLAEALGECLACCERESSAKLVDRLLWRCRGSVPPALRAASAVLAELMDDRGCAAPASAVVPWPSRRRASGTAADHMMIPSAAVPVLAPGMTADAALGQVLRSGEPALPVGEGSEIAGVVTLADLARTVHDSRGVPSIQRVEALKRVPAEVTIDTPLPEVRAAMTRDDAGLVVVRGPGGGVVGYITASSLLGDASPDEDDVSRGNPGMEVPLLGPGGGTVRVSVSS